MSLQLCFRFSCFITLLTKSIPDMDKMKILNLVYTNHMNLLKLHTSIVFTIKAEASMISILKYFCVISNHFLFFFILSFLSQLHGDILRGRNIAKCRMTKARNCGALPYLFRNGLACGENRHCINRFKHLAHNKKHG